MAAGAMGPPGPYGVGGMGEALAPEGAPWLVKALKIRPVVSLDVPKSNI